MAKMKKPHGKKVAGQAEKVTTTKTKEEKINPFEIHFNKRKHSVLGQHLPGEKGRPGISKAKALKKRKLTLLRELKTRTKSNEFVDRRIGEKTKGMSVEDRLAARFAAERKKQNKQTLFNLEENTELTHMGQTLSEIEKYEDPRSDDEGDDALGADFVKSAHFGGGLLANSSQHAPQSRKEWIDQMIADSKTRKYEARRAKEETLEMTDKLDDDYKQVMQIFKDADLMRPKRSEQQQPEPEPKPESESKPRQPAAADPADEYDALVRQLTFEPRVGQASDRTKTDTEAKQAEALRLRQLEEARELRMRTEPDEAARPAVHRSADDLDDGFVLDDKPQQRLELIGDQLVVTSQQTDAPLSSRQAKKRKNRSEQQHSDEDEPTPTHAPVPTTKLPSYKKLRSALRQLLPLQQAQHVTQLAEPLQSQQLASLYRLLLRYVCECCHLAGAPADGTALDAGQMSLRAVDALVPLLYDLTQRLGDAAHTCWLSWLEECWQRRRRRRRTLPGLDTLVPLRLCGQLFPTSDRRHPVTMPAMLMLAQMLAECRVASRRELAAGLLAVSLIHEFTSLSNRLVPESVSFLQGVLYTAVPSNRQSSLAHHVMAPLQTTGPTSTLLQLSASCADAACEPLLALSAAQQDAPLTDAARLTCLCVSASLVHQLAEQHGQLPAAAELLGPLLQLMSAVDVRRYPDVLRNKWTSCLKYLEGISTEKTTLVKNQRRPKPLRLYEPAIEENWIGRRRRPGSADKREHDKLVHKYKRQMRSTVREVRRDNAFVARHKLVEIKSKDDDRKRKLKDLMSSLAVQEGDYKKMKRQK